jgi:hypothetical protein
VYRCLALEACAVGRGKGLLHSERRRLGGDGLGDFDRALDLPTRLDDLLDQPDPMGLGGAVLLAGQQPAHGIAPELFDTEDGREGLRSFVERREARFAGR